LRHGNKSLQPIGSDETGVPLGVDPEPNYGQASVSLAPGDCFTVYTDGISEAMDINNQLYGLERVRKQLLTTAPSVSALGSRLLEDVRRFVGTRPQSDDMCLICVGRSK
jgi:sigma-B regulation protein RsbU (phosphoserine phosphatase)